MKTVVVIPAFNESSVIADVVRGIRAHYPNVVVVDDASSDHTADKAKSAGATVLRHLINRGQGAALKTGIECALQQGAEAIVTFDADGQHSPEYIGKLLEPIERRTHDVVLGSRFLGTADNIPTSRRMMLRLAVLFTRIVSNIRVTDTHNGLRALSETAARSIRITQDRMAHASEILEEISRLKLRYTEVPVHIQYTEYSRQKGQGNMALFKIAVKFLLSKIRQ